MTRKDSLVELRQILLARRDALRMALTGDMSLLNELASQTKGDVVDWALDTVQNELGSQLAEVESRELVMIENALKRMEKGDYGRCEGCDNNYFYCIGLFLENNSIALDFLRSHGKMTILHFKKL